MVEELIKILKSDIAEEYKMKCIEIYIKDFFGNNNKLYDMCDIRDLIEALKNLTINININGWHIPVNISDPIYHNNDGADINKWTITCNADVANTLL